MLRILSRIVTRDGQTGSVNPHIPFLVHGFFSCEIYHYKVKFWDLREKTLVKGIICIILNLDIFCEVSVAPELTSLTSISNEAPAADYLVI
ncbi:hypothetical protein D3C76_1128930 [compost metagenome]